MTGVPIEEKVEVRTYLETETLNNRLENQRDLERNARHTRNNV